MSDVYTSNRSIELLLERQLDVLLEIRDIGNQLLDFLRGGSPTGFTIKESAINSKGELNMATPTVDLSALDDGKGVLYTLTLVPAGSKLPAGSPPIVGTSSSPALTVAADPGDPSATPPRAADTTGLVFLGSIAKPPVDTPGLVVTFAVTLPNGTAISQAAAAVDIVPDPNNPANPTGFTIQEAAV